MPTGPVGAVGNPGVGGGGNPGGRSSLQPRDRSSWVEGGGNAGVAVGNPG